MSIPVPKLLSEGVARNLNNKFFAECKIFPFMYVCNRLILEEPASFADAIVIYSCGLYTLYHDYACDFLKFILDTRFAITDADGTVFDISRIRKHIYTVNDLRALIAHGHIGEKNLTPDQLSNYKKLLVNSGLGFVAMDKLQESDCRCIVGFITSECDYLYDFLNAFVTQYDIAVSLYPNITKEFLDNALEQSFVDPRVFSMISWDITRYRDNLSSSEQNTLKKLRKAVFKKETAEFDNILKNAMLEVKKAAVRTINPITLPEELYSVFVRALHHEITKKKSSLSFVPPH